ncbi:MAG: hypothetical protein JNM83_02320 [Myxococcales bacterium]|nr:hypothetical protein [Myxococcales bacterium]
MLSIEFRKLLEALCKGGTEFIVVGGCAAVLQEVPIATFDVDIVHRRTPENIERLMTVLGELDAYFWPDLARRKLPPRASDLAGRGHVLLTTRLGRLDVLCELTGERGYAELLPHTAELDADELHLRVLDLPMLARVKAEAGRPKDLLAVPMIIAAYEERKKRG